MKPSNIVKYVFILFAVGLMSYAAYTIYQHNKENERANEGQMNNGNTQTEILKDIRLGIANYDNMNPLLSNNKEVLNIDKLIFDPLLEIDENYKIKLCLAAQWSKTNATSYIVKINTETKWQDGTSLTAKDIQFTIERLKEGKSIYSQNVKDVSSVEIVDASTIKINLVGEVPFFEYNLTFPILSNNQYLNDNMNTSTKIPMGTGMYQISGLNSNTITLTKNDKWRNNKTITPKIETIYINLYASMGEVFNSFKIGNIDMMNTASTNFQEYIGSIGFTSKEYAGREYDFLSFNCTDSIMQDKSVRKAIRYAIDKANIISTVFNNQYLLSDFPLDYGNYLYQGNQPISEYNIDQAKRMLEEGGWEYKNNRWQKKDENGTKRLSLTLAVNSGNTTRVSVAEIIKSQLEQIGINVTIKKISDSQYNSYIEKKDYQMMLTGVYNSYSPDLMYYFGQYNLENYQNNEMLEIMNNVKDITDENILKEKYKRLYEIYKEEVPFIGLYRNKNITLVNQRVLGDVTPNHYTSFYHFENWYRQ